jgi:hypothetical protein
MSWTAADHQRRKLEIVPEYVQDTIASGFANDSILSPF